MSPVPKNLSKEGETFIKNLEGFSSKAYADTGGIQTIGWGITSNSTGTPLKGKISLNEAQALFDNHILEIVKGLRNLFNLNQLDKFTQKEYDSIVSFIYNIGIGNFTRSNVYKNMCINNFKKAMFFWSKWTKDSKGNSILINRRKKELTLFNEDRQYMTTKEIEDLFKNGV